MTTYPPPPAAPSVPPINDFNKAADYWYFGLGLNAIPSDTKRKQTYERWSQWQDKPLPEEQFEEWKKQNAFANGMAVMAGKSWRGPYEGKYFTFIDCDNAKAIQEFCTKDGKSKTLEETAEIFLVERHADDPSKCHIFFFSEVPFEKKSTDVLKPGLNPQDIPAFEIKGRGSHGIAYCTPSIHKNGHPYEIIGTTNPIVLDKSNAEIMKQHLDSICRKYGLRYLGDDNVVGGNGNAGSKVPMEELYKEDSRIYQGNNRHEGLMRFMESVIMKNIKNNLRIPIHVIKDTCRAWNQRQCVPPLDDDEFEKQWKAANIFVDRILLLQQEQEGDSEGGEEKEPKVLSLAEVTHYNSGKYTIPKVKIVGVSPPYKLISSITIKCGSCGDKKVEDHTDMPLMSYKTPTRMRCAICKEVSSDVSDVFDHVEAQSITVQDGDMRDDLKRLHVILMGNLTKNIRVGEIVTITGKMTVLNPQGLNNKKATAAMYAQDIRYDREEESPITEDDVTLFRDFEAKYGTETPKELAKMFAPQVIGHDDAKLGILRSAVNIKEAEPITGFRTRIHTDLAGPPGTVKSKLAYEAMSLVANAEWVTSEHATIKSTLAIVDKDPDSGGLMLMLGPIPRAKNSLCGIDEIGTTSFEDQQHYASILEQGRFTKIAYGRDYDIDSPTTIICTTNPTCGYWDKGRKPSLDQIPLKSNIKDRIDQHYIFQDYETDEECRDYAMQKTQNYLNPESVKPDYDFLRRYLAYASSLPVPKLTPEAASMLSFFWQRMRREGFMSNRSFDSLHRIALAQARLHLKSEVDTQVVKEVMQDLQLMFVKLGKLVDTSVEDPRTLAREEIIRYVSTIAFPIDFIDALKHVYEHNELVKQYLGPKVEWWNVRDNRKIRAIYDMFTDGGTGELKKASNGSTIAVHSLKPLTLVRVEVVGMSHASHASPDVDNKLQEESNNEKNPSTGDLSDTSDT